MRRLARCHQGEEIIILPPAMAKMTQGWGRETGHPSIWLYGSSSDLTENNRVPEVSYF